MKARKLLCYILIPIALLLGVLSMPSSSNVEYLPALDFNNPYELKENAEELLLSRINEIRSRFGLSAVKGSAILNKTSEYKALYISQYPDNMNASVFTSGPLLEKSNKDIYPYVQKEEVISLNDSGSTLDDVLAHYFAKTLQNGYTQGRILLDPNAKSIGISIVEFNSKTVCVIQSSDITDITEDINVVPDKIVNDDILPPNVFVKDIYLAKDFVLTEQKVNSAITYLDNSGKACTLSYDLKQIDTTKLGVYNLDISVTDMSGNKAESKLKVNVVPHIYPIISDEEIVLPNVPFDDIFDIAMYVNIQDNYGVEYVNVEPKYALKSDDGKSVKVTVMNKAGLITEKTLNIKFSDIPMFVSPTVKVNSIYPIPNEPLTIEMIKSAVICNEENVTIEVDVESFDGINRDVEGIYYCLANVKVFKEESYIQTPVAVPVHISNNVKQTDRVKSVNLNLVNLSYSKINKGGYIENNSHIVFNTEAKSEEEVKYTFSINKYGEEGYVINRTSESLVWNPESAGLYEIKATVVNNKDVLIGSSSLNLYVSEKTLTEVRTPYIDLKPDSEYEMDSVNSLINNIVPQLKVKDFLNSFVISDEGISEVLLRVKNIQGNILLENAFVGTGSTIELYKGDTIYEKYEILLYGDVNGDGAIDISDYAYIRQNILGNVEIKDIKLKAANIAERNITEVNLSDYAMLRQHLLGNYEIKQK